MKQWRDIPSVLLYALSFLLLLEWIWPIGVLSETAAIGVFILFIAVCLLLFLLRVPMYISILIKLIVMLYLLHLLYFEGSVLQVGWLFDFADIVKSNTIDLFNGNLLELSHLYRSLSFFILLWLMVYLLEYWLYKRKQILLFFFLTLVYITFLDTFTPYDASGAIVRSILIGFFMIGILTFQRYSIKENLKIEQAAFRKGALILSFMVLFSTFIGYMLPKSSPVWPDPVPHLKVLSGLGTKKTVGYGEDDTRLGGSVSGDSTVVFKTIVEAPHYWKVETKDVYTGKGWVQSTEDHMRVRVWKNSPIPISSFVQGNSETIERTSKLFQIQEYPHIVYPLGVKKVQTMGNYSYEVDPAIEKIYSVIGSQAVPLESYSVTYEIPNVNEERLKASKQGHLKYSAFQSRYTQLPDQLPQRVRELAETITKGQNNTYDKAKAVESYLRETDYSYTLNRVAIPKEDEDYVDQFLFETMKGYCDNFSTSMVVLLRSLDIPARWVKGYTEGRYLGMEGDLYSYEITNNNAHSWVEVFFPEVGWVSFEPTPGFSHEEDEIPDEDELSANDQSEQSEQEQVQEDESDSTDNRQEENKIGHTNLDGENEKTAFHFHWVWLIPLVLLLFLSIYYAYRIRGKWLTAFYVRKYRNSVKDEAFISAYLVLLKQLSRSGLERKTGQTLRDYAKEIDDYYGTVEMTTLTKRYEQYLYGKRLQKGTWVEMIELWENLIKRTIA